MKRNRGFTLVELIIVMACLGMVTVFFWTVLDSSSKDTYTLNEKMAVQSSVTSLMNAIQQDVQEAKIWTTGDGTHIIYEDSLNSTYSFNNEKLNYSFDKALRTVTRTEGSNVASYNNIAKFEMAGVKGDKYGVQVDITGGNTGEPDDRVRYELHSTFYTRNTK